MNILIFGNSKYPTYCQEICLANKFAEKGHKVYLVSVFDGSRSPYDNLIETHHNVSISKISYVDYRFDIVSIKDKIDVCLGINQTVSHFVADYKTKTGVRGYCIFLDFPVHLIDSSNSHNCDISQSYYYWLNCALDIDKVIFNSSIAQEQFYKRYNRDSHVVFQGLSYDNIETDKEVDGEFMFSCYNLFRERDLFFLLYSLYSSDNEIRHAYYGGNLDYIIDIKRLANKSDNYVVLYENISNSSKNALYKQAQLVPFLQNSEWFGGLCPVEAMSAGTPSLCFDYPIAREIYGDGAVYVKPYDQEDLIEKITILQKDKELNKGIGNLGLARFNKEFSLSVYSEKLLKILEDK